MKIRTAIFVVYVGAAACGFAVLMFFILREVRPRYLTSIQRTMNDAAQLLAASVAAEWHEGSELEDERWGNFETALAERGTGLTVRVYSPRGQLLAEVKNPQDAAAPDGVAKQLATQVLDRTYWQRTAPIDEIRAIAAVTHDSKIVAHVTLSRPVRSVNSFIWSERKKILAGALAIAAVMVAAGWWIAAQLTSSIERLTAYVEALRDGKRATPPATRAHEVATLGLAFEEMRLALEGRQHVERTTQALAHGIKAPLAAVRGAAELLGEDLPAEDRKRFIENLRAESGRIEHIVERLLRLSALEATKRLQHVERLDAMVLAREVIASFAASATVAEVALEFVSQAHGELDERGGVGAGTAGAPALGGISVHGERALLHEALGNLVQNAIEFTPRGGRVTMLLALREPPASATASPRAAPSPRLVEFAVEDTGPGIPPYAVERVFERFYSLERPSTGRKSTGLGLALVREIAHLHGGEASVVNRSETGARATLTLPAA